MSGKRKRDTTKHEELSASGKTITLSLKKAHPALTARALERWIRLILLRPVTLISGEDYEGDYGYADGGGGGKRFGRRVVKAAGAPGRASPTLPPGPGGDFSGLSFVFTGEGKADGGGAAADGGGRVRGSREAMHVSEPC